MYAVIEKIKAKLLEVKECTCLYFKLANLYELEFSTTNLDNLNKVFTEILESCLAANMLKGQILIDQNNNYTLVLDKALNPIEQSNFVYDLHSKTQLFYREDNLNLALNCRIAAVQIPEDIDDINNIIKTFEYMLYKTPGNFVVYNPTIHSLSLLVESKKLLLLLKKSLEKRTWSFAYQPIVDCKSGKIHYYECLLRIPNDENRLISVGPIIPYAEQIGLINVIDHVVIEKAIEELVHDSSLILSVNISNVGILDDHLLTHTVKLLQKHNIAERLIIEITETALNEDFEKTKFFINTVHKFGTKFALDDFGSGFTSFKQLHNLPIDIIKIDGSFIRNITNNNNSKFFVEALIKISEELGIQTVAEFVENGEIAKFLIDLKVDGMQGNFFSPASTLRLNKNEK